MGELLAFLVVAGGLGSVVGVLAWVAAHTRRRGIAGTAVRAALASHDEAWKPTAYDAHYEIQAQAELSIPFPSPDDPARRAWATTGPAPGRDRRPGRTRGSRIRRALRRSVGRLRPGH